MSQESTEAFKWWYESPDAAERIALFHSPEWHQHKGGVGRLKQLVLRREGQAMAHLSVRELWVPGVFKRWVIQGEPYGLVAPVDHRCALDHLQLCGHEGVDVLSCTFNMARWSEDAVSDLSRVR